jgi:hypothetical protein
MPAPIDEIVRRRVVQEWLAGESRDKISADNNIGSGTVASIVEDYKIGLDNLDFSSFRDLMLEAKKRGMTPRDLASHFRLFNYLVKSGANENEIESFITNVNSGYIPLGKAIELINQIYEISKSESVAPDQLPNYIRQKLEEKQRIDEQIKEADSILQSKNVNIEAIYEHIQLNEELKRYRLSTKHIHKLLNLLLAAKEYRYSAGKIVGKLRSVKGLENKENRLKNSCEILSKKEAKYKETIPLADLIETMHIGKSELISFKIAINEAAELYGFPRSTAAVYVLNNLRDYNKRGQLKKELSSLYLQKFAINEACSRQSQSLITLARLQSQGITEDRLLYLNNFLENNGYNVDMKSTVELDHYTSAK